jgi:hypothetical protein
VKLASTTFFNKVALGQRGRAADLAGLTAYEVAFLVEMAAETGVKRDELLQRFHASKTQHCPLSSRERQVRIFGPNRFHQNRTVSWQVPIPHSNSRFSTLRKLNG